MSGDLKTVDGGDLRTGFYVLIDKDKFRDDTIKNNFMNDKHIITMNYANRIQPVYESYTVMPLEMAFKEFHYTERRGPLGHWANRFVQKRLINEDSVNDFVPNL